MPKPENHQFPTTKGICQEARWQERPQTKCRDRKLQEDQVTRACIRMGREQVGSWRGGGSDNPSRRASGGRNMEHITVPKVRRRVKRGWELRALFRYPTESPGTPSQTFSGSSLTPFSCAGTRVLHGSHPLSTKLNFSKDRPSGGGALERWSAPTVPSCDKGCAPSRSLPALFLGRQFFLAPQQSPHAPPYSSLLIHTRHTS